MPVYWVNAYTTMLSRLQAQEDLRFYEAAGLAFGSFKESKKMLRTLNRAAGHGGGQRRKSKAEAQVIAASIGIGHVGG